MLIDNLFSGIRWKIIQALSYEKLSPMQLAEKNKSTIANISQQLRLLEASGIVKKERVPNKDKGKPRTLYSLSKDVFLITAAFNNYSNNEIIYPSQFQGFVLKSSFILSEAGFAAMNKLYWLNEDVLAKSSIILQKGTGREHDTINFVLKDSAAKIKLMKDTSSKDFIVTGVKYALFTEKEFEESISKAPAKAEIRKSIVLYDSLGLKDIVYKEEAK